MPVFSKFALASVAAADFYALAPGLQSTAPAYSLPTPAYAAPGLKGSIGEGPNHSNHSNRSNSFKIGIFTRKFKI